MHLGQKPSSLPYFTEQPGPKQLMLLYQQGPHLSAGSVVTTPQSHSGQSKQKTLLVSFSSSGVASIHCFPIPEKHLLSPLRQGFAVLKSKCWWMGWENRVAHLSQNSVVFPTTMSITLLPLTKQ